MIWGFLALIILLLGVGVWLLKAGVTKEELARARKSAQVKNEVSDAVREKELQHKKDLSAASDFQRAARMWDDNSHPKAD